MKFKRLAFYFVASLVVSSLMISCVTVSQIATTSGVREDLLKKIPKEAKAVIVEKGNASVDSLYEEVYSILLSRNHRILKDDKERHYITTEGKDIGESTLQRMTIIVTKNGDNAKLKITSEWKAGSMASMTATAFSGVQYQPEWANAKWELSRLGIAFGESVAIANEIQGGKISYE